MINRLFIFLILVVMAVIFLKLATNYSENTVLSKLGHYYAEQGPAELGAPNLVTAVVVTYRGLDTLGEVTVLFISAAGVGLLLRRTRRKDDDEDLEQGDRAEETAGVHKPASEIVETATELLLPMVILFGIYVFLNGHLSPGGGFQGGVIFGAAIILFAISTDLRSTFKRLQEKTTMLCSALGVLIYAGTGLLCFLFGGNFLDYGRLAGFLGVDPVMARSHGILIVEIGVGLAVMAVMVMLYYNLSSAGRHDEGL